MVRYAKHEAYPFWRTLKEGYDYFELTRQLPTVAICNRHYVVNVAMRGGDPTQLDPGGACPAFLRPRPDPFKPRPGEQFAEQRIVVPGTKMRGSKASMMAMHTRSPYDDCWWPSHSARYAHEFCAGQRRLRAASVLQLGSFPRGFENCC